VQGEESAESRARVRARKVAKSTVRVCHGTRVVALWPHRWMIVAGGDDYVTSKTLANATSTEGKSPAGPPPRCFSHDLGNRWPRIPRTERLLSCQSLHALHPPLPLPLYPELRWLPLFGVPRSQIIRDKVPFPRSLSLRAPIAINFSRGAGRPRGIKRHDSYDRDP